MRRDCVEFVRAVGLALHLKMPVRHVRRWAPQAYVRALLGCYLLHGGVMPFMRAYAMAWPKCSAM
jgi:NADH:ubiquinone oxidoreductase subunit 4 (subunit M)